MLIQRPNHFTKATNVADTHKDPVYHEKQHFTESNALAAIVSPANGHDLDTKTQASFQRGRPVIDVAKYRLCGGNARVIAAIEDKAIIDKILTHLQNNASSANTVPLPQVRAPPVADLFS